MIRAARTGDEEAMLAFLMSHIETSMFLAGNLLEHGLFERAHRHGTEFWLVEEAGEVKGVLAATTQGNLMAQCPGADVSVWNWFAEQLSGRSFQGMTGEPRQVEQAVAALNIPKDAVALDALDPLMVLDLASMDAGTEIIRPATREDGSWLAQWWHAYFVDADLKSEDDPTATELAKEQAEVSVTEDRTRLLIVDGQPVAMSSINARVKDTVQIGGVFTPKPWRGRGYAGRAIAGQLAQARNAGVTKALLFAASEGATRAYTKIGFKQVGSYRLFLTKAPVSLGGFT